LLCTSLTRHWKCVITSSKPYFTRVNRVPTIVVDFFGNPILKPLGKVRYRAVDC